MPSLSKVGSEMLDGALPAISGASLTNLDARDLENALPAISGASLTGIDGGDKRNFIIDGDFTQWPQGTAARTIANAYGPALMYLQKDGDGTATIERSTSVPTFAQSGYSSKHSMLIKCTGTDASVAAGAYKECSFRMSGTDFNFLKGKEVTVSFWAKTAAANSGDVYCYQVNKTGTAWAYLHEFTATSSWQKFTHTFTMDSVATADDETGYVYFGFGLGSTGSTYQGTNNTWNSGWKVGTSGMNNFFDSTSNELYISQHMVTLGSSAPSAFISPPLATVKDQVGYYVEELLEHQGAGGATARMMGSGFFNDTDSFWISIHYTSKKRKVPVITYGSTMTHYSVTWENNANYAEAFNQVTHISKVACAIHAELDNTGATHGGYGALLHAINTAAFFLVDARH